MMNEILTIIIPVRFEAETIAATLEKITMSVHTPHKVFVVDDCIDPSDNTKEVVQTYIKNHANVLWMTKKKYDKDGFGPVLTKCITYIRTPYTLFLMADGCDNTDNIDDMVGFIQQKNADVVCGSRYIKYGKKIGGPFFQNMCSKILNFVLYIFHIGTTDATNAFKLYKTQFLRSIQPKYPCMGVEFSLQLTIHGYQHHGIYMDIPTVWRGRTKGDSKVNIFHRGPKYISLLMHFLSFKYGIFS